jgi:hypothetical protein
MQEQSAIQTACVITIMLQPTPQWNFSLFKIGAASTLSENEKEAEDHCSETH